ncbi:MAG: 2-phosphosulfolactate phosphatase [Verrucomicrobia bacterium]|nr:2-phosphosulfolactate phosphatase [Verrucomicrobiota bacterium]MBV9128943.1 2-phosphosulfolactate phosphatase [Verrucomicrobiota bacterium]MBV9643547.1 2-phosphosulfolactate phosphatase [Verrucomicrobiota bacterium]
MIQVALCPSEIRRISATDLSGVTAVVFDVLRATSSVITGLASGVEAIIPVRTVEEARDRKRKDPELLLAGERDGLPPQGFDLGNSPEEFAKIKGRRVVMTTTNGTAAIESVRLASKVLIGALLNLDALADYLFTHPARNLLLVCAGTGEEFSLEDAVAAGALVARLPYDQGVSDSAIMTRSLYERVGNDLDEWLRETKNGKHLQKIGKGADIRWCARLSVFNLVCQLSGGNIISLTD